MLTKAGAAELVREGLRYEYQGIVVLLAQELEPCLQGRPEGLRYEYQGIVVLLAQDLSPACTADLKVCATSTRVSSYS